MAAKNPPLILLATLFLSSLLLPLAPARAFTFDCANEVSETVSILSFCNGDGWRHTCLYGGGYATDGSGECTRVDNGALYCTDCQGTEHVLERCCDIDLSGYELSAGQQANTYDIEAGISVLQCPGNSDCADFGYPQCNGGGYDGITPYFYNEFSYSRGYDVCPDSSNGGVMLRALERPRPHSSGVRLREAEESAFPAEELPAEEVSVAEIRAIAAPRSAQVGGVTKMRRRLWGSGRPWSPPKMYRRRLWGSGRPWTPPKMYRRRLWGSGRPWSPPKMYRRRLWGSGRPWSPPKMYRRRLYGSGRQWYP
ncbi:hypothetical protein CLOM_g5093 [Closterium sp. NIES-68]|nr:hypothetical protein CLOM_g5093 [Closterium sp. NIES-68]GJP79245.1 hypothetical protein CLOP_g9500 [Closterium sp. NIES-67]